MGDVSPWIDGLEVVTVRPGDPRYPAPGHVNVSATQIFVRADDLGMLEDAIRTVASVRRMYERAKAINDRKGTA